MKLINFTPLTSWDDVIKATCTTTGNPSPGNINITPEWKRSLLLSEHSPIRLLTFYWTWIDLPYWVSVHLVRHKIGIEHFVQTQRTNPNRHEERQDVLVSHSCVANAQAIINISRKRLCNKAARETKQSWWDVIDAVGMFDLTLSSVCVPECVYRGFCPERKSCNYFREPHFAKRRENYLLNS